MNSDTEAARALLAFYVEAGADALIGETPVDRMADEPAPAPPPRAADAAPAVSRAPTRPAPPSAGSAPPPPDVAVMAAREAAANAKTLDELRALLENFRGCALHAT